jgi:ABC-2 type transport system ATP-binding protein
LSGSKTWRKLPLDEFDIVVKGLDKSYGKNIVLRGLEADFRKNIITAVIGPNGSGKTTLFKLILGISRPNGGTVVINNDTGIGFMLENFKPYERLSLVENMRAFSRLSRKDCGRDDLNSILSFTFCDKLRNKKFGTLSAGQQRKFLFALSLIGNPGIIILDEPLNSLDLKERIDMVTSIKYLKETRGTTIIVSSHDLTGLYELCDDFLFLKDGIIAKSMNRNEFSGDGINNIYLEIYK